MDFNFPLLLVIATALTGGIWLLDMVWWRPLRRAAVDQLPRALEAAKGGEDAAPVELREPKEPLVVEYAKSFFPIILAVLLLRSFVIEPFRIPSGSMLPTLLVGDFILVNKYAYGLRLPVLNTKVIEIGSPQRGDVAVFRYPRDPSIDYIKRVVGLPGDRIGYFGKRLHVNGEPVSLVADGNDAEVSCGINNAPADRLLEQLGAMQHAILVCGRQGSLEGEYVVPAGHYFVMGDNRDNSNDSRYWGFVPEGNLVGKAFMIWLNIGEWGRIGSWIE